MPMMISYRGNRSHSRAGTSNEDFMNWSMERLTEEQRGIMQMPIEVREAIHKVQCRGATRMRMENQLHRQDFKERPTSGHRKRWRKGKHLTPIDKVDIVYEVIICKRLLKDVAADFGIAISTVC